MTDSKPVATPVQGTLLRLDADVEVLSYDHQYVSCVGSIMYVAVVTRPDLAFGAQNLARHCNKTGQEHWVAAKRMLWYITGKLDLGLTYGPKCMDDLSQYFKDAPIAGFWDRSDRPEHTIGFTDSNFTGDVQLRRSTIAYLFKLFAGVISWNSRLHPTVTTSTVEAEYVAAYGVSQEAAYVRRLLSNLGFGQKEPTTIFADSQGAIAVAQNPTTSRRCKHVEAKFHFTRQQVEKGVVRLVYVPTEFQLADIMTKALDRPRFIKLRNYIMRETTST